MTGRTTALRHAKKRLLFMTLLLAAASGSGRMQGQTAATAARASEPLPRQQAPRDVTGYWVSVVSEDWHSRMVTPPKGDFESVPLNTEGRRVANLWDPAREAATGGACKAYGAAAIMRMPGRVRITWEGDTTLKIETDAGSQTRRLLFGRAPVRGWRVTARGEVEWFETGSPAPAPSGPAQWQGYSVASWEIAADPAVTHAAVFFAGGLGTGVNGAGMAVPGRFGSLHAVTTRLKAGFLRKNGVPYSAAAVVTEDFDFRTEDDGTEWFTVTTVVEDPTYLASPFVTSTDFRKEPDGSKWRPTPCAVNVR
jgi:hypothetical protein